ncbi:MAG: 4'-phosphopantetheinyl transferase superfamily protein [Ktedonobacteraceae bacterium]
MIFPAAQWLHPPDEMLLANDEIHIWCASLDQSDAFQAHLWGILSADEQVRAKQFRFEAGKRHFIVGRGLLRLILGRYQQVAPKQLQFSYSTNGKPFLAHQNSEKSIQFNVSHSQSLALYAFVQHTAIGVDIEYMRPFPDAAQIVDHFFSVQEKALFHTFPTDKQTEAFFAGWTRKEAYLKACGDGLLYPLHLVEVSLTPGEPAHILSIGGSIQRASQWFLQDLVLSSGYKAALAIEGGMWNVKQWQWTKD